MLRLRLQIDHGDKRSTLDFASLPVRIGREETNECRLEFPFVSRSHARLELRNDRLVLVDCGSSLGTSTGEGQRLRSGEALDLEEAGGTFRIGPIVVRVEFPARVEPRVETVVAPESLPSTEGSAPKRLVRVETLGARSGVELPRSPSVSPPEMLSSDGERVADLPALSHPGRFIGTGQPQVVDVVTRASPERAPAEGFAKLLEPLDPERIERETEGIVGRSPLRFRALWEEYARRYAEVVRRAHEPPEDRDGSSASVSDESSDHS